MKLVRYEHPSGRGVGIWTDDNIQPTPYTDMREIVQAGIGAVEPSAVTALPLRECRLLAPLPAPGKLLFSGLNYRGHTEENPDAVLPESPQFFAKLPSSVIGPGEAIMLPSPASQVDYEGELAAVIGATARRVARERALEYVFGYTVVNDVSARDVQFKDNQITTGKGFDTFCPMGPAVVTYDEIDDPQALHIASYVNGERRQYSSTADMIFPVAELIAFISTHITLHPGDIISTGTPAGVGTFRYPPTFLQVGDLVEVEVDVIGRLSNPVIAG